MARYIDADEGKKRLFSYYDCVNELTSKDNYHGETLMSYEVADMIEDCIENTPTADVQEVRHGRWISEIVKKPDWIGKEQSYYQPNSCSICHTGLRERTNFCPNCGAKMDGKE